MNFKQIIILGFLLISSNLFAQNMIKGKVVDEKSLPIINAEIYVDNSTIKSKTNEKGEFELNLPNGQYNLIVRASLFENYILNVNTNQTNFYKVVLETEEVSIENNSVIENQEISTAPNAEPLAVVDAEQGVPAFLVPDEPTPEEF